MYFCSVRSDMQVELRMKIGGGGREKKEKLEY
jgi:hypothetical protein